LEKPPVDRAGIARVAKALVFICGADHPTTVAFKVAVETGSEQDIKRARTRRSITSLEPRAARSSLVARFPATARPNLAIAYDVNRAMFV
jgi:hypothetical protein